MEIYSGPHSITFSEYNDSNSSNQEALYSEFQDDRTAEAFRTKVSQIPRSGEHRKYSATPFSEVLIRSHSRDRRNASFPYCKYISPINSNTSSPVEIRKTIIGRYVHDSIGKLGRSVSTHDGCRFIHTPPGSPIRALNTSSGGRRLSANQRVTDPGWSSVTLPRKSIESSCASLASSTSYTSLPAGCKSVMQPGPGRSSSTSSLCQDSMIGGPDNGADKVNMFIRFYIFFKFDEFYVM